MHKPLVAFVAIFVASLVTTGCASTADDGAANPTNPEMSEESMHQPEQPVTSVMPSPVRPLVSVPSTTTNGHILHMPLPTRLSLEVPFIVHSDYTAPEGRDYEIFRFTATPHGETDDAEAAVKFFSVDTFRTAGPTTSTLRLRDMRVFVNDVELPADAYNVYGFMQTRVDNEETRTPSQWKYIVFRDEYRFHGPTVFTLHARTTGEVMGGEQFHTSFTLGNSVAWQLANTGLPESARVRGSLSGWNQVLMSTPRGQGLFSGDFLWSNLSAGTRHSADSNDWFLEDSVPGFTTAPGTGTTLIFFGVPGRH